MAGAEAQTFEYRLQRLPLGMVMLDRDRRVRAASAAARKLLGGAGDDIFGADILDLHPPEARAKIGWLIANAGETPLGASDDRRHPHGQSFGPRMALKTGPDLDDAGMC